MTSKLAKDQTKADQKLWKLVERERTCQSLG